MSFVHAFDRQAQPDPVQPPLKKRLLRPGQLERLIKTEIIPQSVEDVAASLRAHHLNIAFPKKTEREIERLLHLQRLRDLGMTPGQVAVAMERL
jgi:hypothetical protein